MMLVAAAITVNKALFGNNIVASVAVEDMLPVSAGAMDVDADGNAVIHTSAVPGTVNGYAGPVHLDIYIADGKISDIKPLPNADTPSFFRRASELFGKWIGKSPDEALEMNVDGISGATYSSTAIINNINAGLSYYKGAQSSAASTTPWKIWVALAVTLAACLLPLFVRNRVYHNAQLVANVVVLGFWCGQFLDYTLILKYMSEGLVFPAGRVAALMLIAAFVYPLFGKHRHYCTYICPLGSAQQIMGMVCGYKIHISTKVLKILDWSRKILWAVLMLSLWTDCLTGWMNLELFQAFQFRSVSWWIIGAACLFLVLSAVVSRPYCRFVCPTGSLFKCSENIG